MFRVSFPMLALVLRFSVPSAAGETLSHMANSKAEKFVAESLRKNGTADLSVLPDGQRTLRAAFLRKIFFDIDGADVPASAIAISNATVIGSLMPPDSQLRMGKSVTVSRNIGLVYCHFDLLDLSEVTFENGLSVAQSDFRDLILSGINLKGRLMLSNIRVRPPKDPHSSGAVGVFLSGNIDGTLYAGDISPALYASRLTATHVQVQNTRITDPPPDVHLPRLQAEDVMFYNSTGEPADFGTVSLTDASVKDDVSLDDVQIKRLSAKGLRVGSYLHLGNTRVQELLDLSWSSMESFQWDAPCDGEGGGICWPKRMFVSGISFRDVDLGPIAPAKGTLLDDARLKAKTPYQDNSGLPLEFLRRADFSEAAYATYSQLLRNRGLIAAADDAQREMHAHKREARWRESIGFFSRLGAAAFVTIDLAQLVFLGYGQSALPPLLWAVAFVLFGTVLFRNEGRMEVVGEHPPRFSPFWYSLELFLPVVDLGVAKNWRPSQKSVPLLTYARIHQLAGWILIPVALATLTGAFK
jgi:hypothetical protein